MKSYIISKKYLLLFILILFSRLLIPVVAESSQEDRIEDSLFRAAQFLVSKQGSDGLWRSETYGCFKDGLSLTPYIMSSLFFMPQGGEKAQTAFRRGVDYLINMVDKDGNIALGTRGINFPIYTAASASRVVVLEKKTPKNLQAQSSWLNYVIKRQLNESLGWDSSDPEYGGWGFSLDIPYKPKPGQLKEAFFESNLSATLFGIAALRSARVPLTDPIWSKILSFVKRCQNFSDDPTKSDADFDDGGFFFIPQDPLQNKAGKAGIDKSGVLRFASYGSMTADGVRALIQCGLPLDHPRVVAARKWLEKNFTVKKHPGKFTQDREVLREATYYYYVWSLAHAFTRLGLREVDTTHGKVNWAEELSKEIIKRQMPDGAWVNSFTDAKEDDPLVSTPWAASALAICKHVITTSGDINKSYPRLLSAK